MIKKFSREISVSQSQYRATIERKHITQQCSYNLPLELEEYLKALGAIEKVDPSSKDTNATYKLTNGYKTRLGPNIIAAISDSYKTMTNKVVFTHTEGENGSSKKFQLKKTDFKAQNSDNYTWFVDLYNKNIEGTILTVVVDDEKKTVSFNLELTPYFFTENEFSTENYDVMSHNLYGIHIKEKNDALSEDRPHICLGWSAMGDISNLVKEDIENRHTEIYPNASAYSRGQDVGQIHRFINEAKIGDYVVFSEPGVCHIGRITSEHYYDSAKHPNQSDDYVNARNVEWLKTNIKRSELSKAFHNSLGAGMSFWGLNDYKSAVHDLLTETYVKDEIEFENNILSYDELEKELKKWWVSNDFIENRTSRLVAFGFKYAESVQLIKGCSRKLLNSIGSENMWAYIDRGKDLYFAIKNREIEVSLFEKTEEDICTENFDYSTLEGEATNKILYGVPGCGKSYHIENIVLKDYKKENKIRTTFYQDYSNTDFVGQILPKIIKGENGEKDTVEYIFNPGPFTLALIQAISNPTKKVALVVEEINRGNAPAIFGDIFQLLDRDANGISEYGIVNVGMIDYLNGYEFTVDGEKKHYHFKEIKIPGNMYIFATMNTSDQNVYTLDTAFTRRWRKERITNEFSDKDTIGNLLVPGMKNVTWEKFVTTINNTIQNKIDELQVNEDKQIGKFFVKESDLMGSNETKSEEKTEAFAYKVLEYLWDDVSKLDHTVIFNPDYKTFAKLVEGYKSNSIKVFCNDIANELAPKQLDNNG